MEPRRLTPFVLTILGYIVVTFAVQGTSHFAVNAGHYAGIGILRPEPIMPLGLVSMIVQGSIFALLYPAFHRGTASVRSGVVFAWALGGFLASYIAFAEPGKYAIPAVPAWIAIEVGVAAVQFTLFGVLLGLVHRRAGSSANELTARQSVA